MFGIWTDEQLGLGQGNTPTPESERRLAQVYQTYGPGLHTFCQAMGEWVPMPFILAARYSPSGRDELMIAKVATMKGPIAGGIEPFEQSRFRRCFPGYESVLTRPAEISPPAPPGTDYRPPPSRRSAAPSKVAPESTLSAGGGILDRVSSAVGLPAKVDVAGFSVNPALIGIAALGILWFTGRR